MTYSNRKSFLRAMVLAGFCGVSLALQAVAAPPSSWKEHLSAAIDSGRNKNYEVAFKHLKTCLALCRRHPNKVKPLVATYMAFYGLAHEAARPQLAKKSLLRARKILVTKKGAGHDLVGRINALLAAGPKKVLPPLPSEVFAKAVKDLEDGDPLAIDALKQLVNDGHGPAARVLAFAYLSGKGAPLDELEGLRMLRVAALARDGLALRTLAQMTATGDRARQSKSLARTLMGQAAEAGDPQAAWIYSQQLEQGFGGPVDQPASQLWRNRAFALGVDGSVPSAD